MGSLGSSRQISDGVVVENTPELPSNAEKCSHDGATAWDLKKQSYVMTLNMEGTKLKKTSDKSKNLDISKIVGFPRAANSNTQTDCASTTVIEDQKIELQGAVLA